MSYATLFSPIGNRDIVVTQYSIGLVSVSARAQGRLQQFVYPIRMRQEPFKFVVQCRSEQEKEDLIQFTRKHHMKSLEGGSYGGQLRFFWFQEKIDFLGWLKGVTAGAVRFQPAPALQFEMIMVKDLVYERTNITSSGQDWTGVYSGEVSLTPPGGESVDGAWHWVSDPTGGGHWEPGPAPDPETSDDSGGWWEDHDIPPRGNG